MSRKIDERKMGFKVRTNIQEKFEEIEVVINAPEKTEEVERLEEELNTMNTKTLTKIIGYQGNDIFIIKTDDVIYFYSEEKNNYCKTNNGIYMVKEKMYYLDDMLKKNKFIRISNSAIVNVDKIKCFNTSIIGKIIVKFNDNTQLDVARRRTKEIMKFLKERRD